MHRGLRRSLSTTRPILVGSFPDLEKEVLAAAASKQTGVSLATLLNFGRNAAGAHFSETLDRSAHFLKHELPIRFAHRAVELDSLPHGLSDCEGIKTVSRWYKQSFAEIRSFPTLRTLDDEARFSVLLTSIYERHNPTIIQIAKGIYQFRRKLGVPLGEPLPEAIEHTTKQFLDIFFTSRVGIRTLIGQHLAMHQPRPYYVGIINTQTRPALTIANAAADAAQLCERRYGDSPKIEVVGARDFSFSYVDSYLHHIAFELLKNSLRATMETHGNSGKLPQIRVILSASNDSEDVTIKISDEGGGIARSGMKRLFSYFYSTAPPQFNDGDDSAVDFSTEQPFAGLGVGLALSRIYCQYWGGELALLSMENYGTDAYIYLRRLGDAAEPLSECGDAPALAASRSRLPFASTGDDDGRNREPQAHAAHASFRVSMKQARPPGPTSTATGPAGGQMR